MEGSNLAGSAINKMLLQVKTFNNKKRMALHCLDHMCCTIMMNTCMQE